MLCSVWLLNLHVRETGVDAAMWSIESCKLITVKKGLMPSVTLRSKGVSIVDMSGEREFARTKTHQDVLNNWMLRRCERRVRTPKTISLRSCVLPLNVFLSQTVGI